MDYLKSLLLFLVLALIFSSCADDGDYYTPAPSGKTIDKVGYSNLSDDQKKVVDYFDDIALGFEYGEASRITRKWNSKMSVFVSGNINEELSTELQNIIDELNTLATDGFVIELVDDQAKSNYHVFIGPADAYVKLYPDVIDLVDENWGLFSVFWDQDDNLTNGHMYVDNVRADSQGQKHLLREEFTQSLGLARDATTYSNSIFQAAWTTTNYYAEIDKDIIHLLYHPKVTSGLSKDEVNSVLVDILLNE